MHVSLGGGLLFPHSDPEMWMASGYDSGLGWPGMCI